MTEFIQHVVRLLPLELFVFLGSLIEEVFAPIPSPLIMTTAAVVAVEQQAIWWDYVLLAVIGAIGKTLASWAIYWAADKGEDVLIGRFGRYIGVKHEQIEGIGAWFSHRWWDELLLVLLRAVPIAPNFFVSVACGLVKMRLRPYLVATFVGSLIRISFYLLVGIYGWEILKGIITG